MATLSLPKKRKTLTLPKKENSKPTAVTKASIEKKKPKAPKKAPKLTRNQRRRARRSKKAIAPLALLWPRFSLDAKPLPLALNIAETLIQQAKEKDLVISPEEIRAGLKAYAHRAVYARAVAKGGLRYDAYGKEVGEIAPEHQQYAKDFLGGRRNPTNATQPKAA